MKIGLIDIDEHHLLYAFEKELYFFLCYDYYKR